MTLGIYLEIHFFYFLLWNILVAEIKMILENRTRNALTKNKMTPELSKTKAVFVVVRV